MAAPIEHMCLIDAEENKEYVIIVNAEDAEKARKDMIFAATLLQTAKKQQCENIHMINNNASTVIGSSNIVNTNVLKDCSSENSISDSTGSTEGTHVWSKEETLLLLNIYSNYKEKFNSGKGTVKQYWHKIACIMNEEGYKVSGLKCATKFQALKRTYKCAIDHNNKSGNSRKEWEYLKYMEELFADKPWIQPISVAGSHIEGNGNILDEEKENTLERRTKRKKLNTVMEEYLMNIKEEQEKKREMRERHHEEKMNYMKKIENIMEKLLDERK